MSAERAILNLEAELHLESSGMEPDSWWVAIKINGNLAYRFQVQEHEAYSVQYRSGSVADLVAQHFFERLQLPAVG